MSRCLSNAPICSPAETRSSRLRCAGLQQSQRALKPAHDGRIHPGEEAMNVAQMSRTARVALAAAFFATPVLAQLPSGRDLHAKYVAASGGAENIRKHTSMHMTAEFEIPAQGMKGNVEAWSVAPDKFLSVVEIPGLGTIKQGFDGSVGWGVNPMTGATVLTGKELAQMKEQADMHALLNPGKFTKSRETVEQTKFDGKDAYKVKVIPVE